MVNFCVVPGCPSKGTSFTYFKFPVKNIRLMKKWVEIMKTEILGVEVVDFTHRRVCEKHFDKNSIKILSNGRKLLTINAVPSLFIVNGQKTILNLKDIEKTKESKSDPGNQLTTDPTKSCNYENSCRICLKEIPDCEESLPIGARIMSRFKELTNTDLVESLIYPQQICLHCDVAMKNFHKFRWRVKYNQSKLKKALEQQDLNDPGAETENTTERLIRSGSKRKEQNPDEDHLLKIKKEEEDSWDNSMTGNFFDPLDESFELEQTIKLEKEEEKIEKPLPERTSISPTEDFQEDDFSDRDSKDPDFEVLTKIPRKKGSGIFRRLKPGELTAVQKRMEKVSCPHCSKILTRKNIDAHISSIHLKNCKFECEFEFFLKLENLS